jgi:hypothetical protein
MQIDSAKYVFALETTQNETIKVVSNGVEMFVPLDPDNSDYAEIMRQVEAGELTIADAD